MLHSKFEIKCKCLIKKQILSSKLFNGMGLKIFNLVTFSILKNLIQKYSMDLEQCQINLLLPLNFCVSDFFAHAVLFSRKLLPILVNLLTFSKKKKKKKRQCFKFYPIQDDFIDKSNFLMSQRYHLNIQAQFICYLFEHPNHLFVILVHEFLYSIIMRFQLFQWFVCDSICIILL